MRSLLILLAFFAAPALAQVGKAASDASKMKKDTMQQQKASKAAPKKAEKKAAAKKADSASDWSQFQGSAKRDLKADEDRRKAKAAKK